MGDLWDAITWQNLLDKEGAVMGYADGTSSAWPPEAWAQFQNRPTVEITVTADERFPVFDAESGDATNQAVATGVANRLQDGLWSTVYSNQANLPDLTQALRGKSLVWRDASYWPEPGVYLHIADPSGNIAGGRWHPPVTPVAVQDVWSSGWDHSTTVGSYPAMVAPIPKPPPTPQPTARKVADMFLVELNEGPNKGTYWLVTDHGVMQVFDALTNQFPKPDQVSDNQLKAFAAGPHSYTA